MALRWRNEYENEVGRNKREIIIFPEWITAKKYTSFVSVCVQITVLFRSVALYWRSSLFKNKRAALDK